MPDSKITEMPEKLSIDGNDLLTIVDVSEVDPALKNKKIKSSLLGGGIVDEVVAGANTEVDSSDPSKPIVSAASTTSAGLLRKIYFTGEETTIVAGTFYQALDDDQGVIASVEQQVVLADDTKLFFPQDAISDPSTSNTTIVKGSYSGFFSVKLSPNIAQQRYGIEAYLADVDGNVIDSGILTEPVGDLGVRPIGRFNSSLLTLESDQNKTVVVSGTIDENLPIVIDQRVVYHSYAEKVGTPGGNITASLFFGTDWSSFFSIPLQTTTTSTINDSDEPGATATDALNSLKDKADHLNVRNEAEFVTILSDASHQEARIATNTTLIAGAYTVESTEDKRVTGGVLIFSVDLSFVYGSGNTFIDVDTIDLGGSPITLTLTGLIFRVKRIKGVGLLTVDGGTLVYEIAETTPIAGTGTVVNDFWDNTNDSSGTGTDVDAIHVNVANEISGITEKVTPIAADIIVIEDSADAFNKKKVQIGNLPGTGGGEENFLQVLGGETVMTEDKGKVLYSDLANAQIFINTEITENPEVFRIKTLETQIFTVSPFGGVVFKDGFGNIIVNYQSSLVASDVVVFRIDTNTWKFVEVIQSLPMEETAGALGDILVRDALGVYKNQQPTSGVANFQSRPIKAVDFNTDVGAGDYLYQVDTAIDRTATIITNSCNVGERMYFRQADVGRIFFAAGANVILLNSGVASTIVSNEYMAIVREDDIGPDQIYTLVF